MPDDLDLLAGLDLEPRPAGGDTAGRDRSSDAGDHSGDRERGTGSNRGTAEPDSKREALGADKPEKGKRTEKSHRQSVADSIKNAWREHSGDEGSTDTKPSAGRERGPDGKFVKTDQAETNTAKPLSQEDGKGTGTEPTAGSTGSPSTAPNGWNDAAKAEWAKLPPAVRDAVTKRETDMTEGAKQLQQRYGPIYNLTQDQTIAGAAQKYGVTREQLLFNGFSWMIAVERNPAAGILGLCQAYKIDPKTLSTISATAAPAAQPGVQGTTTQLQDPRVAQLEARLNAFEQTRQTEANATQQAAIAHWSKDKKHFERVRPTMVQVIQIAAMQNDASILDAQGNVDLNKVYARAVRLHDDVFNDVLRESRSKRQADQTAEAQKARRTAASVSSGSPAGTESDGEEKPLPKGSSVRQHITAAMRRVRA